MDNLDFHNPVLLNEVVENLAPKAGEIYLDGTFGAGGYSRAILEKSDCKLYAIDRDKSVKKFAKAIEDKFGDRFKLLYGNFSQSKEILEKEGITEVDGMVFDIGVSSMQFDEMDRGFSFDSDAKLDMRMDQDSGISAYEVINEFDEKELVKIIKEFGEEPKARKIAKKIIAARTAKPISSCRDLACIVRSLYPGYYKTDPATRTFQALRIFVNQELEELKEALNSSLTLLKKGGRLVVVSFHSLEDQIVKKFLKVQSGTDKTFSRYQPEVSAEESIKNFEIITRSAISPTKEEVSNNPRSRSSKMRVAVRI